VPLDDVLGELKSVGVTAANLTEPLNGVFSIALPAPGNPPPVVWGFTLPVPMTGLNGTLAALAALPQNLSVTYAIQGTQVSTGLQAANPCPYPALLSDAQRQAQALAQAAGGMVGPIVAISDQPASGAAPSAVELAGDFSAILNFTGGLGYSNTVNSQMASPPPTCSLTVQFKLQH